MKIFVKVKPNAKKELVEKIDETNFNVFLTAPPTEGKANKALIEALAEYFGVAKQRVKIVIGERAKQKIVSIE